MASDVGQDEPMDARMLEERITKNYKRASEDTIRELASVAYSEADLQPWSLAFKLFWKRQNPSVRKQITEILLKVLVDSRRESRTATGVLTLMVDVGVWKSALNDIVSIGKSVSGPEYRDFKLVLGSLLLDEGEINTLSEVLGNDPALEDYASTMLPFAQIPFGTFLNRIAEGATDADYRGMFLQLLTSSNKNTIHKIAQTFFEVFFKNEKGKQGENLLRLMGELAHLGRTSQMASEFLVHVLDSPPVLRMFRDYFALETQEFLRPLAVREPNLSTRKWLQKIAIRPYVTEYPAQKLAARGNLGELSLETQDILSQVLNRYRKSGPRFDVQIVEAGEKDNPEEVAFKIRSEVREKGPYVDLDRILSSLGLGVVRIGLPGTDVFDGCLLRAEDLMFPIVILNTTNKNERRIRFTIGHEIGHFVMPDHARNVPVCSVSEWTGLHNNLEITQMEKQADAISAALLMPREFISMDARSGFASWTRINELTEKYGVSTMALVFRMVQFVDTVPTAVFRFSDGECDYCRFSPNFPLDFDTFPGRGDLAPPGSGAERISKGEIQSLDRVVEIGVWTKRRASTKGYTRLRELSKELGSYGVMTIVELEDPDEEELHEEYRRDQKPFGFGNMYRG